MLRTVVAISLSLLASCSSEPEPPSSPNVVIFLADDQGWGDLSLHGNTNLSTPNIDSLAADGAMLERFYVCSVCAPTRAEFLTGRYYARGGVRGVSTGQERLNLDEVTIADTFKEAGYATGAFGKWHNGTQAPYHPYFRGFGEFYGFTEGHWGHYFDYELDSDGILVTGNGFVIDDFTNRAIGFIEANKDRPFFAYLPYNTPHSPMQVPDEYWDRFESKELGKRHRDPEIEDVPKTRAALAMVENIDWNVGRVLAKLDQLGLRENMIVLYFSDNGPNSWRWNDSMKGRKGSIDEGGLRSPFVIRWPGTIPEGKRVTQIGGAIDILPTLADLTGVPLTSEKPLDGKSLKPLLVEDSLAWPDRMIFSLRRDQVSVRNQRFRLDAAGRLFDIDNDPGQNTDVAAQNPEITSQLSEAGQEWLAEVLPLVGPDDRPFPIGGAYNTRLPARDGVPHGAIQRSARAPNCSFFTNWTSIEDSMTWDVEVLQAGVYLAKLYYTAKTPGSIIELEFDGATINSEILEAHDPPLYGASDDRVPRGESEVKDFKEVILGAISLKAGRGSLTLRATEVAGDQVADIRYVAFERL